MTKGFGRCCSVFPSPMLYQKSHGTVHKYYYVPGSRSCNQELYWLAELTIHRRCTWSVLPAISRAAILSKSSSFTSFLQATPIPCIGLTSNLTSSPTVRMKIIMGGDVDRCDGNPPRKVSRGRERMSNPKESPSSVVRPSSCSARRNHWGSDRVDWS